MRSHGGEREQHSLDSEDVSPTKVNPLRPRYTKHIVGQPAKGGETCIYDEEMCTSNHRNDRGDWGGRASKDQKGKPREICSKLWSVVLTTK
jgi:hypothetical protein